jgi:ABC-type maltose transport systems, permease component
MKLRKTRRSVCLLITNLLFIILCIAVLIPIFYALSVSLSDGNDIISSRFSFIPKHLSLENYRTVLFQMPFFLWLKNSLVLAFFTVLISVAIAVFAAYACARYRFKGRKSLMYLLLLLNAFPSILSMFALYRLLRITGLMNSYAGLTLIYTGSMTIFSLWNMKGYFDTIPVDIEQAARIDGATDSIIIREIILPLAKPTIIVTAVLVLLSVWNDYIFAINFLSGAEKYTLAVGLYSLQATDYTRNWPLFSAASLLASLPALIIFFLIQRHMRSGLTAGGVKE